MKILIAAKHTSESQLSIGGVQTWCDTVKNELLNLGHEVKLWCPEQKPLNEKFDVGIISNGQYTHTASRLCDKIFTITHGIIPDEVGGIYYTSEELKAYWGGQGGIVRQPIDLNFWKPLNNTKKYLTRFSYRDGMDYLPEIAKELNLEYIHVRGSNKLNARDILRQSSIVIATGRAACEAMACGCSVVIADAREYQGELIDIDTIGAMTRNYSGRGGVKARKENVKDAIINAMGSDYLSHVKQHHDAKQITQQILCSLY